MKYAYKIVQTKAEDVNEIWILLCINFWTMSHFWEIGYKSLIQGSCEVGLYDTDMNTN
jgi:hypothetical protein